jgi:uncharacterized membrane protein
MTEPQSQPQPSPQPQTTPPKQGTGLEQNVAGLLCYLGLWVTGAIFFILEPTNKFVRFHAVQSIVVFGALTIVYLIFRWIPVVGWIIALIVGAFAFILWVVLMVKAYQGQTYKLPVVGDIAEKQSQKIAAK